MPFLIAWAEHCPVYRWGDWMFVASGFFLALLILTPADKPSGK